MARGRSMETEREKRDEAGMASRERFFIWVRRAGGGGMARATPYAGIEQCLCVRGPDGTAECATPQMLEAAGTGGEEAWEEARANTEAESLAMDMIEMLEEMTGAEAPEPDGPRMAVMTNRARMLGASAMLDMGLLRRLMEEAGASRMAVLPSSVHEALALPEADDFKLDGG